MSFYICRYSRHLGQSKRILQVESIEEATDTICRMQLDDLIKFGNSARYRIEDEDGNMIHCFFKLRLGQRDLNLEEKVRKGECR